MTQSFARWLHRTPDVAAAHKFYAAVLGDVELEIVPLPAAAAARGAPAHWLGCVEVEDVAYGVEQLVSRGSTLLGPIQAQAQGAFATVRDPGGALVALATAASSASGNAEKLKSIWSHLDAENAHATFAVYAELFGWRTTGSLDLGADDNMFGFAWDDGGPSVGSYADVAQRAGVHPQWLFRFRVSELTQAVQAVQAHGGIVIADVMLPNTERVVVCDDPLGGAFSLGCVLPSG